MVSFFHHLKKVLSLGCLLLFQTAIDLLISSVQIGIETQCNFLKLRFRYFGGTVKSKTQFYRILKVTLFRKSILVSIESEMPVFYLFITHENVLSRSQTKVLEKIKKNI